jgi:ABC-type nitrate/sulfonate/bicarbonate transport system ATPase subunit/ABC-type nitrate/sulfonate/bicarbonate transport system substrate-binding protein
MTSNTISSDNVAAATALTVVALSTAIKRRNQPPQRLFSDVSFHVASNEILALMGRSGVGKSTLLNIVAGLAPRAAGEVLFPARPHRQGPPFAYMFQEDRLLPWRTAEGNVGLALERLGLPRGARQKAARDALRRVGLEEAAELYPWQLSGGMRARVALARALALDAPLLLLDEPFGKLDPGTRDQMHELLLRLQAELGFAALMVTHDIAEAVKLASRIIVLAPDTDNHLVTIRNDDPSVTAPTLQEALSSGAPRRDASGHSVIGLEPPSRRDAVVRLGTLAAGLTLARKSRAQTRAPFRIGYWATGIQLALIDLILERKLFEAHGLAYELVGFSDVNGNTIALATDRIDAAFSVSAAGGFDLAAKKRPVRIILSTQAADGRLVTKAPEIKSIADLRGRTIGMAPAGSAGAAYTRAFLDRSYGVPATAYKIAGGGEARLIQLLVKGDIDAALLREVSFVEFGQRLGLRSLADQRQEWARIAGKDAVPPLGIAVARDEPLATRREEVVAFLAAIIGGIRQGAAEPDFVSELMARKLRLQPDEAKAYADTWAMSFHGTLEQSDIDSMNAAQKLFVQEGSLDTPADPSAFDASVYHDALSRV